MKSYLALLLLAASSLFGQTRTTVSVEGDQHITGTKTIDNLITSSTPFADVRAYANIQAAVNFAAGLSPKGVVQIPYNYAGVDSYTNASNVLVIDERSGNFTLPSGLLQLFHIIRPVQPAPQAPTSFPLGNDLVTEVAGSADWWAVTIPLNLTSSTSVSPGSSAVTISACALGTGSCSGTLTSQLCPPSASCTLIVDPYTSAEESIAAGNWSITDGTHLQITFANSHTQPYTIRQQGSTTLNTNRIVIIPDDANPILLQDHNLSNFARWPYDVGATFPKNAYGFGVTLTGIAIGTSMGHADLSLRNNTSADCVKLLLSAGQTGASFCDSLISLNNPVKFNNGNTFGFYSDGGTTLQASISAATGALSGKSLALNGATSGTGTLTPPATGGVANTLPSTAGTLSVVIASGTSTLTSNATLAAVTSQTAITTAATGALTTDAIEWAYASAPGAGDSLCLVSPYVTSGNVNFVRSNPTAASQNVSAIVINWRVVR